jgi:two-component system phosphate regulon response regulator PhoB
MKLTKAVQTILIVDDDEELREVLETLLSDSSGEGYNVMAAANGRAGLVLARSRQADLIVVDLDMPVLNGEEFVQQLRAEFGPSAPPILLASGRDDLSDVAARLGVEGTLGKPFDEQRFLAAIAAILQRGRRAARSSFASCSARNAVGV